MRSGSESESEGGSESESEGESGRETGEGGARGRAGERAREKCGGLGIVSARFLGSLVVLVLAGCAASAAEADVVQVQPVTPASSSDATPARRQRVPPGFREVRGDHYTLQLPETWGAAEPLGPASAAYLGPDGADGFAQRVELDGEPYDGTTSEWVVGFEGRLAEMGEVRRVPGRLDGVEALQLELHVPGHETTLIQRVAVIGTTGWTLTCGVRVDAPEDRALCERIFDGFATD